jgi:hypothetical protein
LKYDNITKICLTWHKTYEVKNKTTKEFERNAPTDAGNIQVEVDKSKVTLSYNGYI